MRLPYSNSCRYEMVNCDESCSRSMRLKCLIISSIYRFVRKERNVVD